MISTPINLFLISVICLALDKILDIIFQKPLFDFKKSWVGRAIYLAWATIIIFNCITLYGTICLK